jgi:hypothetical protein
MFNASDPHNPLKSLAPVFFQPVRMDISATAMHVVN